MFLLSWLRPRATVVVGSRVGVQDVQFLRIEYPRPDTGLLGRNEIVYRRLNNLLMHSNPDWQLVEAIADPEASGYQVVSFEFKFFSRPTSAELADIATLQTRPDVQRMLSTVRQELKRVGYGTQIG